MDDLRRRLEELADRGRPRGAAAVLRRARGQATTDPPRRLRLVPAFAIGVSVLLVGGVAAAVLSDDDGPKQQVAAPAETSTTTTTAAEAPPTTGAAAATPTTLKRIKL